VADFGGSDFASAAASRSGRSRTWVGGRRLIQDAGANSGCGRIQRCGHEFRMRAIQRAHRTEHIRIHRRRSAERERTDHRSATTGKGHGTENANEHGTGCRCRLASGRTARQSIGEWSFEVASLRLASAPDWFRLARAWATGAVGLTVGFDGSSLTTWPASSAPRLVGSVARNLSGRILEALLMRASARPCVGD